MKYLYTDEPYGVIVESPVDLAQIIELLPDTILFLPQIGHPASKVKMVAMNLMEVDNERYTD